MCRTVVSVHTLVTIVKEQPSDIELFHAFHVDIVIGFNVGSKETVREAFLHVFHCLLVIRTYPHKFSAHQHTDCTHTHSNIQVHTHKTV